MNRDLTSNTFVSGNLSTLASDKSLLFVETSHTIGVGSNCILGGGLTYN